MKNNVKEVIVTVCLVCISLLILNPFDFWMPSLVVMVVLAVMLLLFGIFASFILREKSLDERDTIHKSIAGRNAFLAGSTMMLIGIIIQEYSGQLDPWLVLSFLAMIVTKVVTRVWSDKNL